MAQLTIISWRDIPAQVLAQGDGRVRARVQLSDRFQEAIDEAALRAGLFGTDEYLGEWRRETRPCGDDLDAEARAEAERLEAGFDDEALRRLARAGGSVEARGDMKEDMA